MQSEYWQKVRRQRFNVDGGKCGFCFTDLKNKTFNTHHLYYGRLGHEHLRDVITLCPACHQRFHEQWEKKRYWQAVGSDHWKDFDLAVTAKACAEIYRLDKYLGGKIEDNLCNAETAKRAIDAFTKTYGYDGALIDVTDIVIFVRNKRYELFFEAEDRGLTIEQFLDERFGKKERGKNPIRADAGACTAWKHKPASMHKHYSENENINKLMKEAKKYEQTEWL